MTIKAILKKWAVMLVIGMPILYWLGTTLLKDTPDLLKVAIYILAWYLLDWLVKKVFGL